MAGPDAAAAAKPRRNPFLALVDGSDSSNPLPLLDPVWLSRTFNVAQTVMLPFAFYFKPVIVLVAVTWLFYRAYQVLNKPLEELAGLLGFDIPSAPVIDLASIKADGAIVHWSLPDKQKYKSSFKFEVHLNGDVIGTLSIHDSAATITGLQPACFYVLRVSLINNVDFSSRSDPIRFRTKPATSGDFFAVGADGHDTDHDGLPEPIPRITAFKGLKNIAPASNATIPMHREGSTGLVPRRSIRRASPSAVTVDKHDPPTEESEAPEGAETIQQLTEKLDAIRREIEEAEKVSREEDEEEARQKDALSSERDDLKAQMNEKEKASRNLKREVNTLERQNTAAQNERTKQERILQQRKHERQKLNDDIVRWTREAEEMKTDLDHIRHEKDEHLLKMEDEKQSLRKQHEDELTAIRVLDEEMKEKSTEIKKIERAMKNSSPFASEPEPNLVQQLQQDAEEKRQWDTHYAQMQQQYTIAYQKLEQAKIFHREQVAYLESLRARRKQEEQAAHIASPPPTLERPLRRGDSQRSRRAQSGHSSSDSPRMGGFPITSAPFVPAATSTASMFSSAPFLNIQNGMTISAPTEEITMSEEEREHLTGGAPMSPEAGAQYLPTNLFGDGEDRPSTGSIGPIPGLGSLPGLPGIPGPSTQPVHEYPGPGPASPASASSRSASVFASPHASQQNLYIGSPEQFMDADRRSVRSNRSNRATSGGGAGSRFSGMFGIKQRAKTTSADEGPALGKAQSHSMPRQDQGTPGIDSNSRKRNSSISASVFSNPSVNGDGMFEGPQPPPLSRSRRALNFFSRDKTNDGWPSAFRRPASPRPDSTHSTELPRPSMDSSRWGIDTWPSNDAAGGARSSPLAFGAPGWNTPQQSRLFGSRHPSRRPSVQQGNDPPEDILEDDDSDFHDSYRAAQLGAIGTKPPAGSKKAEKAAVTSSPDGTRLNPAAKDFKSFFSSMKLTKDKSKDGTASSSGTPNLDKGEFDESPPHSRKSKDTRDTYSMTTNESSLAESSRNSVDLAGTPSYSTSDAPAPSPMLAGSSGKESFMQKLSRKSSSSKFTMPTFKREKTARQQDPPTSAPLRAEAEEDGEEMSASVGSMPAKEKEKEGSNRGSVRNWSSVLKLGKSSGGSSKKGNETPSVSGMSLTSAEGEEQEAEE
ncbi:hypothetical protein DOTSEDRAFT_86681 [Lecanosticta acicola]|uniref:Fibronectin type-III domain-containing protein n=1 Tax=Lecanosticta acicola TaxID=111012 RepID=A0AAI9ECU0_9PEZI|nr:hypothetical protein DOTSEDRAFT_86681 [Lecanosticta acicola]